MNGPTACAPVFTNQTRSPLTSVLPLSTIKVCLGQSQRVKRGVGEDSILKVEPACCSACSMVVSLPELVAEVSTGKFCRLFTRVTVARIIRSSQNHCSVNRECVEKIEFEEYDCPKRLSPQ